MLYVQSIEFMQGIENIKVFQTVEGQAVIKKPTEKRPLFCPIYKSENQFYSIVCPIGNIFSNLMFLQKQKLNAENA